MKKLLVSAGVAGLLFAGAGTAIAGTDNPKACFGQDRAAGVHAITGRTWGDIASDRAGDNANQNHAYQDSCS